MDPIGWSVPVIAQSDYASLVVDSVWVNAYAEVVSNAWGVYSAAQKISNEKGTLGTIHAGGVIAAFGLGQNCSGTSATAAN